jgi:hypothetical protein
LPAPTAAIEIAPEYVPGERPAGDTDTLRLAGVAPAVGLTDSQLPPMVVVAVTLKLKAAPVLCTNSAWAAGWEPPVWYPNASAELVTTSAGAAVTVKVTATVEGLLLAPDDVTVIAPEYVPGDNPLGTTEAMSDAGVAPATGVTASHPPPVEVVAAAVKDKEVPELPTVIDWLPGMEPPT